MGLFKKNNKKPLKVRHRKSNWKISLYRMIYRVVEWIDEILSIEY